MPKQKCSKCGMPCKGHVGPSGAKCQQSTPTHDESYESSEQQPVVAEMRKDIEDLKKLVTELVKPPPLCQPMESIPDISKQEGELFKSGEQLLKNFPIAPNPPTSDPDPSKSYDPRNTLTVRAKSRPLHITDFLSEQTKLRIKNKRQNLLIHNEDGCMQVRADNTHPYAGVSLAEWGGANMRLLNQLLASGKLLHSEVEYYLAYTANIFDFHSKYQWASVLNFDFYYREQQSEHGFMWGHINPLLELNLLKPLETQSSKPHNQSSSKVSSSFLHSEGSAAKCKQWLSAGYCRFGESCKYAHPPLGPRHQGQEANQYNLQAAYPWPPPTAPVQTGFSQQGPRRPHTQQ